MDLIDWIFFSYICGFLIFGIFAVAHTQQRIYVNPGRSYTRNHGVTDQKVAQYRLVGMAEFLGLWALSPILVILLVLAALGYGFWKFVDLIATAVGKE